MHYYGPALWAPYSDQSVLPSSVRPRYFVRIISSFPLLKSCSKFTYNMPLCKRCAVILNEVCRSRSYQNTQFFIFFNIPFLPLYLALALDSFSIKIVHLPWTLVKCEGHSRIHEKSLSRAYLFSPWSNLAHTLTWGIFEQSACSDRKYCM